MIAIHTTTNMNDIFYLQVNNSALIWITKNVISKDKKKKPRKMLLLVFSLEISLTVTLVELQMKVKLCLVSNLKFIQLPAGS